MRRDFVEIRAYCKINLALDILRLREDGYHEVEMILQTIPLWDTVTLRRTAGSEWRKPVTITSNAQWLPQDEKNTAYRAAYLLARDFAGWIRERRSILIRKCRDAEALAAAAPMPRRY